MTSRSELRAMLDKATRYIASAMVLRESGDHDSAVSRLYYAMFYCAEALLLARGRTFSSHRAVISEFGRHFVKGGLLPEEMHAWLREAFEQRQIGEYEFGSGISDSDVADLTGKAERFFAQTEAFLRQEGSL